MPRTTDFKSGVSKVVGVGAVSTELTPAPATGGQILVLWKVLEQQEVPLPSGFMELEDAVAAFASTPDRANALERSRRKLAVNVELPLTGLARLRLSKGLSQQKLADLIKTSQSHVARIETGRENVLLATAVKLASALETSLAEVSAALGFGGSQLANSGKR